VAGDLGSVVAGASHAMRTIGGGGGKRARSRVSGMLQGVRWIGGAHARKRAPWQMGKPGSGLLPTWKRVWARVGITLFPGG
jgi:hypothetical protein